MITQSQAEDIGLSRWGMPEAKEAQSKKYKSEFEKDILKLQEAVFLEQISNVFHACDVVGAQRHKVGRNVF